VAVAGGVVPPAGSVATSEGGTMTNLVCPKCGEAATVRVDVLGGDSCRCDGCEEEYTIADVRALVASWGPLLAWLDSHPAKTMPAAAGVTLVAASAK